MAKVRQLYLGNKQLETLYIGGGILKEAYIGNVMVYGGKVDNGKFIVKINPVPFNLLDSILTEIGYNPGSTEVIVTCTCGININSITNGTEYISTSIIKDSASELSYKVNNFDNILEREIPEGTTNINGMITYKICIFAYTSNSISGSTKTFINKITSKNDDGNIIIYEPLISIGSMYKPYYGISYKSYKDGLNKSYIIYQEIAASGSNTTLFSSMGAPDVGNVNMDISVSPGQLSIAPDSRTMKVYYHIYFKGSTSTNVYYDVTFNVHSENTTSNEKRFSSTTNFAGGIFTFDRYSPQNFMTSNTLNYSNPDTFSINSNGLFYLEIRNPVLKRNNSSGTDLYYIGYGFYFGDNIDANMPINEQSLGNGMLTFIPESKNTLHVAILVSETSLSKKSDSSQTLTLNIEGLSSTQISSATATIAAGGYVNGHAMINGYEYTFNLLDSSFSVPVTGYVELLWLKDVTIKTKSTKYGYSIKGLEGYTQLNKISNTEFNIENAGALEGSRSLGRNTKTFTLTFKEYVEETPITNFYITNSSGTYLNDVSISFYSEAKERYYDFSTSVSSNQAKTKIGELKGVHWYESIKVSSLDINSSVSSLTLRVNFPGCKTGEVELNKNGSNKHYHNDIGFINIAKNGIELNITKYVAPTIQYANINIDLIANISMDLYGYAGQINAGYGGYGYFYFNGNDNWHTNSGNIPSIWFRDATGTASTPNYVDNYSCIFERGSYGDGNGKFSISLSGGYIPLFTIAKISFKTIVTAANTVKVYIDIPFGFGPGSSYSSSNLNPNLKVATITIADANTNSTIMTIPVNQGLANVSGINSAFYVDVNLVSNDYYPLVLENNKTYNWKVYFNVIQN